MPEILRPEKVGEPDILQPVPVIVIVPPEGAKVPVAVRAPSTEKLLDVVVVPALIVRFWKITFPATALLTMLPLVIAIVPEDGVRDFVESTVKVPAIVPVLAPVTVPETVRFE